MKRKRRWLSKKDERVLAFAIVGALIGTVMFATGWGWSGVIGSIINGAVFFGLPAMLPRTIYHDRMSRTLVGAGVGLLCGWIAHNFSEEELPLHQWLVGMTIFSSLFFFFAGAIWGDD